MKLLPLYAISPLVRGLLLSAESEAARVLSRNLASIPSVSCDPSTTDNTIIHTGDSVTLNALALLSELEDGYITWASQASYDNSAYIPTSSDRCKGIGFYWTIDSNQGTIQIAAAVQTGGSPNADGNNNGWAAIGFSETGGMRGADVVYFTSSSSTVADGHIHDSLVQPTLDKSQDWDLIDYVITDDGYLIFEASRALDTMDIFDRPFVNDAPIFVTDHRLIGAWGSTPTIMYHGMNRVRSSIQLFSPEDDQNNNTAVPGLDYDNFLQEMSANSDGSVVMALTNYSIPAESTYYHEECYSMADLIDLGVLPDASSARFIVGHEIILQPETVKFMHHVVMLGSDDGCNSTQRAPVVLWTPGEDFLGFPPGVGIKYGGTDSFTSLTIQYHIDNRHLELGKVDTGTGIRLYYTDTPVNNEIGILAIGDPQVKLIGKEVGSGLTKHSFTCPSTCSQNTFTSNEVTIVKELLHMHSFGKRIVNQVLRDDEVVHETYIDYWDYDQTGIPSSQNPPYQFQKGDSFRTICYFNSNSDTKFGLGSQDEMCMTFIFYFPKQNLTACGLEYHLPACEALYDGKTNLTSEEDIGRVFATST